MVVFGLAQSEFEKDPLFGFLVPKTCEGVPPELLNPRHVADDEKRYEERARRLAASFKENFRNFEKEVSREVLNVMP